MKYLIFGVVALTITPTIETSLIPSLGWGFFIVGMFLMGYRDLRDPQSKGRTLSTTVRRPQLRVPQLENNPSFIIWRS